MPSLSAFIPGARLTDRCHRAGENGKEFVYVKDDVKTIPADNTNIVHCRHHHILSHKNASR